MKGFVDYLCNAMEDSANEFMVDATDVDVDFLNESAGDEMFADQFGDIDPGFGEDYASDPLYQLEDDQDVLAQAGMFEADEFGDDLDQDDLDLTFETSDDFGDADEFGDEFGGGFDGLAEDEFGDEAELFEAQKKQCPPQFKQHQFKKQNQSQDDAQQQKQQAQQAQQQKKQQAQLKQQQEAEKKQMQDQQKKQQAQLKQQQQAKQQDAAANKKQEAQLKQAQQKQAQQLQEKHEKQAEQLKQQQQAKQQQAQEKKPLNESMREKYLRGAL